MPQMICSELVDAMSRVNALDVAYGLMEPNAFVDEMRERMELAQED